MAAEPEVWHELETDEGVPYYYSKARQVTQWERPEASIVIDMRPAARAAPAEDRPTEADAKFDKRTSFAEKLKAAGQRLKLGDHKHATLRPLGAGESSRSLLKSMRSLRRSASREPSRAAEVHTSVAADGESAAGADRSDSLDHKDAEDGPSVAADDESAAGLEAAEVDAEQALSSPGSVPSLRSPRTSSPPVSPSQRSSLASDEVSQASMSSRPRPQTPSQRLWVKQKTETVGADKYAEFYYFNRETGETQWQRPDGYESDEEIIRRVETNEIAFDKDQTVVGLLTELGALGVAEGGSVPDMVVEREEMHETGEDRGASCEKRLRQIFLAAKYCGSQEEWEDVVRANKYELVHNIFLHWGKKGKTPTAVRSLTCILLDTFCKLDAGLIRPYSDGNWGLSQADFFANLELGLQEAIPDEGSLFSWLSLLYNFLTEVPSLPPASLPGQDTLEVLVSCMGAKDEDVFLMATYVILALNSHYGYTGAEPRSEAPETGEEDMRASQYNQPNPIVQVLDKDRAMGELFSEAVLHLLNGQSYPYDDPVLLGQLLYMVRAVFSTRATSEFFHTTDLRVIVDIIIRQIRDLPPEDEFRGDYLRILHLILINARSLHKYRSKDIQDAVEFVLASAENGMLPLSCAFAVRILLDCMFELEGVHRQ